MKGRGTGNSTLSLTRSVRSRSEPLKGKLFRNNSLTRENS